MLNKKEIEESLQIENGKVYAVFSSQQTRRQLNGCEERKNLAEEILAKQTELESLKKQVEQATSELTNLLELDNKLVGAGCCKLDTPVYKKIDGITQNDENGNPIIDHYTHDEFCSHKGE